MNKLIEKWEKEINFRKEGNYKTFAETLEIFVKELEQDYQDKLKKIDVLIQKITLETKVDAAGLIEKGVVKGLEKAKQILEG